MVSPRQHDWRVADREYERHETRRGRRHAYPCRSGERTALVAVDLVPFFVAEHPDALGVIEPVNRLAARVRAVGGMVAWVTPSPSPSVVADEEFFGRAVAVAHRSSGGGGEPRRRLWHALATDPDDLFVEKSAPSACFPRRSDLDAQLAARGVDTVLIAGTVANVCCESSVRDASTLGYRVVMVADANAANSDDELNATLHTVYRSFGDVRPVDELIAAFEPA